MAGAPYDTLEEVIGLRGTPGIGSLQDFGVSYRKLDLQPSGSIDWDALASAVRPGAAATYWGHRGRHFAALLPCVTQRSAVQKAAHPARPARPPASETKVALVQRSCGYALRPTLRIDEIERAVAAIKAQVTGRGGHCWGQGGADCGQLRSCHCPPPPAPTRSCSLPVLRNRTLT